jgi:hypothetical protein
MQNLLSPQLLCLIVGAFLDDETTLNHPGRNTRRVHNGYSWWILVFLVFAMFCFTPAQAAPRTYTLPSDISSYPFNCRLVSGTTYRCPDDIDLDDKNVTIIITSDLTLLVDGDFKAKQNFTINANGHELTIEADGDIEIDKNFSGEVNLIAGDDLKIGKNSTITGDLKAGDSLELDKHTIVYGNCSPSHPYCMGGGGSSGEVVLEHHFDECIWENAGDVTDSSGKGFHATAFSATPDKKGGVIGASADLSQTGTDDYLRLNHKAVDGLTDFTLSLWFKTSVTKAQQELIQAVDSNARDALEIYIVNSDGINIKIGAIDHSAFPTNKRVTDGNWHNLTVRRDTNMGGRNSEVCLFIDGSNTYCSRGTYDNGGISVASGGFIIGQEQDSVGGQFTSYQALDGQVDELIIFNKVLSDTDIEKMIKYQYSGYNWDGSEREPEVCDGCELDYFEITQDGMSLACPSTPARVTVTAKCADDTTKTDYLGAIKLATTPNGGTFSNPTVPYTFQPGDAGTKDFGLYYGNEGTVVVTATDGVVTSSAVSGTDFRAYGFLIDNPATQASCAISPGYIISAYGQNPKDPNCSVISGFNGSKEIKAWFTRDDPSSGSSAVNLNGVGDLPDSEPGSANAKLFFNRGQAKFQFSYPDAGRIKLHAKHDLKPYAGDPYKPMEDETALFVVKPAKLIINSNEVNADCAAGNASCSRFRKAGEGFGLTVSAACADNRITPNFKLNKIAIRQNLVAPLGGSSGNIALTSVDITNNGQVTGIQGIDEAGVFSFTATPPLYFGELIDPATSENIGRFYPARLDVSDNRPSFAPACSSRFSYFGQEFGFGINPELTVSGLNVGGNTTLNYDSAFWKLSTSLSTRVYSKDTGLSSSATLTPPSTDGSVSESGANDLDGSRIYIIDGERLTASKGSNAESPIASSVPLVDLTIFSDDFKDSDGVCYDPDNNGSCDDYQVSDIAGTALRYGEGFASDVHGTQGLTGDSLVMPVGVNYWDGGAGGWLLSAYDSCSSFSYADSGSASVAISPASPGMIVNGTGNLDLTLTADGLDKSRNVSVDWPDWLEPDNTARAHFGIYRGDDRFIYWREVE